MASTTLGVDEFAKVPLARPLGRVKEEIQDVAFLALSPAWPSVLAHMSLLLPTAADGW